jgi:hypothetical protein
MAVAIATFIVPYLFMDLHAMPLAVAIATIYHNVQYFGFVWMTERERTDEMVKVVGASGLGLPQRLAQQASWVRYFGLALLYSVFVLGLYLVFPRPVGVALIYFVAFSHYIVDGYMWRRERNHLLVPVLSRLAWGKPEGQPT